MAPLVETDGERTARLARKRSALRLLCVLAFTRMSLKNIKILSKTYNYLVDGPEGLN